MRVRLLVYMNYSRVAKVTLFPEFLSIAHTYDNLHDVGLKVLPDLVDPSREAVKE